MINVVVLTGRLTKDVEVKTINDKTVCNFTIANEVGYGDKANTSFLSCVVWNAPANYLSKYGHKGDLVGLEGELVQRTYQNKEGKTVSVLEIQVKSVELYNKRVDNSQDSDRTFDNGYSGSLGVTPKQEYSNQQTNAYEPKKEVNENIKPTASNPYPEVNNQDLFNSQSKKFSITDDDLPF